MADSILVSRVMLDAIRSQVIRDGSFFRDMFFGGQTIETSQPTVTWDVITSDPKEIPCVGYQSESSSEAYGSFQTQTAAFECFRHGHVITPNVLRDRLPGLTEYDDADKIARLQDLSWARLDRLIRMTEERMAVEALTSGQVSVKREDGSTLVIAKYWDTPTTGGANDPVVTAAEKWTADGTKAGKIVSDILGWVDKIIENGGTNPRLMVVSSDVAQAVVKAFADTPYAMFNPATVSITQPYDSEAIRWIASVNGVDIYQAPPAVGGLSLLPSGSAVLGSAGESVMAYGPTYLSADSVQGTFSAVAGRRTLYTKISADPVAYKNIIQSAPLPIIRRKWDNLVVKGLV